MSPQRGRAIARELSGLEIDEAMATLAFMPNRAAAAIAKVVKSAAANAEHNFALDRDALRIRTIVVDDGPSLRRFWPRSRGRVGMYLKRSGHIRVTVEDGMG